MKTTQSPDDIRRDEVREFIERQDNAFLRMELTEERFSFLHLSSSKKALKHPYHGGRIMRALREANIRTVGELIAWSYYQCRDVKYMGRVTYDEIKSWLYIHGFSERSFMLGMTIEDVKVYLG